MTIAEQIRTTFDARVADWVALNESPNGQLRHSAILHRLRERLAPGLNVLDVGCAAGELAADLARDGHSVTLLDLSPGMLEQARARCRGLAVRVICGDAAEIDALLGAGEFDAAFCHSMIEFVPDPAAVFRQVARVLRPGGMLSVVFGNRLHSPLKFAIVEKDLRSARRALDEEPPRMDPFGFPRRTFYPEAIREMVERNGFKVTGEYGICVFADLTNGRETDRDDLFELELSAGGRLPYRQMGRFVQLFASKV